MFRVGSRVVFPLGGAGGLVVLLAACDNLRLPALPARTNDTALVAVPTAKAAKAPAKRPAVVDPQAATQRYADIQRGLRRLVVAEETYYAENGIYTQDLPRLGFTPPGGSQLRFLWAGRGGWAASGTHEDLPGRDCVIYVGREREAPTTVHDGRRGREGVPACDGLPARATRSTTATSAPSQPSAPASGSPAVAADTGSALDQVEPTIQMRVDLRNLVRSQDTWYGTQGAYSRRTEPFALQYLWHRGVTITILSANDVSWSARATHANRPGKSCVIWFGPVASRPVTLAQRRTPERPAVPVCDE